ncbi:MAG TPA: hypothetical protein VMG40_14970, partial [Bryobacteraceae bacterium]|nr:hypothetical protein [Bryobacteraceae bacterium]
ISPYLSGATSNGAARKKSAAGPRTREKSTEQQQPPAPPLAAPPVHPAHQRSAMNAQESLLLWGLFQRLPKPGTPWQRAERDRWMETLSNVLTLEYPEA